MLTRNSLVSNFQQTYDFFTTHFNLKATDILHTPDGVNVSAFTHVDREQEWVDHHTFFFRQNTERIGVHHCSFEVNDPDIQAIGHEVSRTFSMSTDLSSGSSQRVTHPLGESVATSSAPRSLITGTCLTTL